MTRLTDWHDGDRLSAAHLQEAVDMLHQLSSTTGAGGTEVTRFPMGTAIHSSAEAPPGIDKTVLVVCSAALTPSGLYAGNAVDVNPTALVPTDGIDPAIGDANMLGVLNILAGSPCYFLNLLELTTGTHDMTAPTNEAGQYGMGQVTSIKFSDGGFLVVGVGIGWFTCIPSTTDAAAAATM